jgi:hypothetical protein
MKQKLYWAIVGIVAATLLGAVPARADGGIGLTAEPGVIKPGETTNLILSFEDDDDEIEADSDDIGVTVVSWMVQEPDGDTCQATGLPDGFEGEGSITKVYPTDFEPVGGGECDTNTAGEYPVEVMADVEFEDDDDAIETDDGQTERTTFRVSFFVLPESPIGAVAIIGSSLGALAALAVVRRFRARP